MQFIGIAHVGPGFLSDLFDRRCIEFANFFENGFRQHPPHLDCTRSTLFERRVV